LVGRAGIELICKRLK